MNGWENHETWNVALWIANDEGIYKLAKQQDGYGQFVSAMSDFQPEPIGYQTPDGVAWNDSGLDLQALDELISEL